MTLFNAATLAALTAGLVSYAALIFVGIAVAIFDARCRDRQQCRVNRHIA